MSLTNKLQGGEGGGINSKDIELVKGKGIIIGAATADHSPHLVEPCHKEEYENIHIQSNSTS